MRIPQRIHRDLPDDAYWIISDHPRQLTVYLATDIEPDSPLEQHFVRQACRAWRRRHYPGPLVLIPITGTGAAWALKKLRHPLAATGVVAGGAMVALAAVSVAGPDEHPPRPAVMGTPPSHSPVVPPPIGNPAPSRPPATSPPPPSSPSPPTASPSPPTVTPTPQPGAGTLRKPRKPHPTVGRGNAGGKPGRTPPGHVAAPPGHGGTPPGKPPAPPGRPVKPGPPDRPAPHRLIDIRVGDLLHIEL